MALTASATSLEAVFFSTYPDAPAFKTSLTNCRLECIDRISTFTPMSIATIWRVASSPFKSGMAMSIRIRLGVSLRTRSTASRPLSASPTISTFGSRSSTPRSPARTTSWSSARMMRMVDIEEMNGARGQISCANDSFPRCKSQWDGAGEDARRLVPQMFRANSLNGRKCPHATAQRLQAPLLYGRACNRRIIGVLQIAPHVRVMHSQARHHECPRQRDQDERRHDQHDYGHGQFPDPVVRRQQRRSRFWIGFERPGAGIKVEGRSGEV